MQAQGLKDASVTVFARVSNLALMLATQCCLAWWLGPAGRGSYAVCIVFASLLATVVGLGSDIAVNYSIASRKLTLNQGITYTLLFTAVGSAIAACVGLGLMQLPVAFFSKASPGAFRLSLLFIPASLLALAFASIMTAVRQFRLAAALLIVQSFAQLTLSVVLIKIVGLGLAGALWGLIGGCLFAIIIGLGYFGIRLGFRPAGFSPAEARDVFVFGLRFFIGKLGSLANMQIGTIILAMFATKAEIGLFAVAMTLVDRITIIPNSLVVVLLPRVAGDDRDGRSELIARCERISLILCGALLAVICALAYLIVPILFSARFLPAVPLIWILAPGVLIRCATKVIPAYLVGVGKPGQTSIAVGIGLVVNLILLYLLLPAIGLAGAALATAASHLTISVYFDWVFRKHSKLTRRKIWRFHRQDWSDIIHLFKRLRKRKAA